MHLQKQKKFFQLAKTPTQHFSFWRLLFGSFPLLLKIFSVLPETFYFPLVVSCVKGDNYNSGVKEDQKRRGEQDTVYNACV